MNVTYTLQAGALAPSIANPRDSGHDIYANIGVDILIRPGDFVVIPSGINLGERNLIDRRPLWRNGDPTILEENFLLEAQVRSRSGMAAKYGVFVLNSPGTVDDK